MSSKNMELPKLFKFVQLGALVGSIIFAIIGLYFIISSVGIFDMLGASAAGMALGMGVIYIIGSLTFYGVVSCFLCSVKAQVESRNELFKLSDYLSQNKI